MTVLEWLLAGDPAVARRTQRDLLDREASYPRDGLIERYLALQDPETGRWGGGVYSPKWISTHYTMMELKDLGVDPADPRYQRGLRVLIDGMWRPGGRESKKRWLDACVAAMMLSLCAYGRAGPALLDDMAGYLLDHTMPDGAWNCSWDRSDTVKGSLHTTISTLEAFADLLENGSGDRLDDVRRAVPSGEEFLLKKRLCRSVRTGELIHPAFLEPHDPPRWHFDAFRALDYFARVGRPYDERMGEALDAVKAAMERGWMGRGKPWPGLVHFPRETARGGRFNTLRALRILRAYDPATFEARLRRDASRG